MLTPPSSRRALQRTSREGETNGLEGSDSAPSSGFDDASNVGVEPRAPFSAESVGDCAEGDARPQRPLAPLKVLLDRLLSESDDLASLVD